jgi:hypothetical protein
MLRAKTGIREAQKYNQLLHQGNRKHIFAFSPNESKKPCLSRLAFSPIILSVEISKVNNAQQTECNATGNC